MGALPRGVASLPKSLSDPLGELRTIGRREGGLWAAAGTLGAGAGDSVRPTFVGIILRAAGLPEKVEPAQFVLWLHRAARRRARRRRGEREALGEGSSAACTSRPPVCPRDSWRTSRILRGGDRRVPRESTVLYVGVPARSPR